MFPRRPHIIRRIAQHKKGHTLDSIKAEVTQLQAEIARQEQAILGLEREIAELEDEISEFEGRYQRIVAPVMERLQAVKDAIAELERQQRSFMDDVKPLKSSWTPPEGYVSVEEQFRRVWQTPGDTRPLTVARPPLPTSDDDIKRLYRDLARRYHPDLAADEADRASRTHIMAMINVAYRERDLATLQALAADDHHALFRLELRQLQQTRDTQSERIHQLRSERDELLHSEMLRLKVDEALLRHEKRDLLKEMAQVIERDYWAAMDQLTRLRQQ